MITSDKVALAEYVIDTSGVVDILLDGCRRSNRGRKTPATHYRLLLVGGLLNVMDRGSFVIRDIHQTLTQRLDLRDQHRLGVRTRIIRDGKAAETVLSEAALYNVTRRLSDRLAYGHGSAPDLDDTERERRHRVVQDFSDALMDVFDLGFTSDTYAIDGTGIWSWGRGHLPAEVIDNDDFDEDQAHEALPSQPLDGEVAAT